MFADAFIYCRPSTPSAPFSSSLARQDMLSENREANHWHESEYQLDPHSMQVTETARPQGADCCSHARSILLGIKADFDTCVSSAEPDANATESDNVPVLIVAEAVNKKKAPLKCSVSSSTMTSISCSEGP